LNIQIEPILVYFLFLPLFFLLRAHLLRQIPISHVFLNFTRTDHAVSHHLSYFADSRGFFVEFMSRLKRLKFLFYGGQIFLYFQHSLVWKILQAYKLINFMPVIYDLYEFQVIKIKINKMDFLPLFSIILASNFWILIICQNHLNKNIRN
jgi:hypothetical protein